MHVIGLIGGVASGKSLVAEGFARLSAVVLDARAGPEARNDWLSGHAPGARYLDLERELSDARDPREGGRHPLPAWSAWPANIGARAGWSIE